ncbi:MAG TPA: TrmH family RNA methyltransferase [Candidatus Saccharibacteria bacterium]|nr:TrmH family RNA methyltransferase [Candidatus Saccharibacteria bacterium]HRK94487.1 TrmH family RNA methyltransferase [Candidatus Saccharibacteria bacterium]
MPEITLILHNIRSTHNVGSIFRTAEGFGVKKIILSGYTPYPTLKNDSRLPHLTEKVTAQIRKTALGAETMVPFEYHDNLLTWLDQSTLPLVALEQHHTSTSVADFQAPEAFALLLGEEVNGISDDLLKRVDHIIEIPMKGQKESFNVSVATGIALFALCMR